MHGGFCARHGCAMDAKATPHTTVLPALLRHESFELRALCNVTRVNLDASGKRAVGVTYIDARGREWEQPADLVILTSFTFNNTRLLLLSGIGEPYDPGSGRGVIGRNYAYQATGHAQLFFEDKVFNRFMGGGGAGVVLDDFNGDNFDHAGLDFFGGAYLALTSMGAAPVRSHPVPAGTPRWGGGVEEGRRALLRSYAPDCGPGCLPELPHQLPRPRPDVSRRVWAAAAAHDLRLASRTRRPCRDYTTEHAAEIGKRMQPVADDRTSGRG